MVHLAASRCDTQRPVEGQYGLTRGKTTVRVLATPKRQSKQSPRPMFFLNCRFYVDKCGLIACRIRHREPLFRIARSGQALPVRSANASIGFFRADCPGIKKNTLKISWIYSNIRY